MSPVYRSQKAGQSFVSIPKQVAQAIKWQDQDKISVEVITHDGKVGLFLTKKDIPEGKKDQQGTS